MLRTICSGGLSVSSKTAGSRSTGDGGAAPAPSLAAACLCASMHSSMCRRVVGAPACKGAGQVLRVFVAKSS
eukprot:138247-Amphidinium_carterae.1